MERLNERIQIADQAHSTLKEILNEPFSKINRDASIQRFEYTFEAAWKAAQLYLRLREGIESNSPKGVMRACFQINLLNEEKTKIALQMVDDRNLTSHTYNEGIAQSIYSNLPIYSSLIEELLHSFKQNL